MTGLVGLAFKPTDRLMGTRSSLGEMTSGCQTSTQRKNQKEVMSMNPRYLNKVRFSSLRSREQRVMQSWSSTKG